MLNPLNNQNPVTSSQSGQSAQTTNSVGSDNAELTYNYDELNELFLKEGLEALLSKLKALSEQNIIQNLEIKTEGNRTVIKYEQDGQLCTFSSTESVSSPQRTQSVTPKTDYSKLNTALDNTSGIYTQEELEKAGFSSVYIYNNYFDKTADGRYTLKVPCTCEGENVTTIQQLKEVLTLVSAEEFIEKTFITNWDNTDLTKDIKRSLLGWYRNGKVEWDGLRDEINDTLREEGSYRADGYGTLHGFAQLAIDEGWITSIDPTDEEINQAVDNYIARIAQQLGKSPDKVSESDFVKALYCDSEYTAEHINSQNKLNNRRTICSIPWDYKFELLRDAFLGFSEDADMHDAGVLEVIESAIYSTDENVLNHPALKLVYKLAGCDDDDNIRTRFAKVETYFNETFSKDFRRWDLISIEEFEMYLFENEYIEALTYSEEFLSVLELTDEQKAEYFYQDTDLKGNLVYKTKHNNDSSSKGCHVIGHLARENKVPEPILPNSFYYDVDGKLHQVVSISTAKDLLVELNKNPNGHFVLTSDIDMSELGENWVPIEEFTGHLYGNGYTIKNLTIETENQNAGFFGVLSGKVENLTFDNAKVLSNSSSAGKTSAGVLAGRIEADNEYDNIANVRINNSTVQGADNVGTLAGSATGYLSLSKINISGCEISGNYATGGFIGEFNSGKLWLNSICDPWGIPLSEHKNSISDMVINAGTWGGSLFGTLNADYYTSEALLDNFNTYGNNIVFNTGNNGIKTLGIGGIAGQASIPNAVTVGFRGGLTDIRFNVNGETYTQGRLCGWLCNLDENGKVISNCEIPTRKFDNKLIFNNEDVGKSGTIEDVVIFSYEDAVAKLKDYAKKNNLEEVPNMKNVYRDKNGENYHLNNKGEIVKESEDFYMLDSYIKDQYGAKNVLVEDSHKFSYFQTEDGQWYKIDLAQNYCLTIDYWKQYTPEEIFERAKNENWFEISKITEKEALGAYAATESDSDPVVDVFDYNRYDNVPETDGLDKEPDLVTPPVDKPVLPPDEPTHSDVLSTVILQNFLDTEINENGTDEISYDPMDQVNFGHLDEIAPDVPITESNWEDFAEELDAVIGEEKDELIDKAFEKLFNESHKIYFSEVATDQSAWPYAILSAMGAEILQEDIWRTLTKNKPYTIKFKFKGNTYILPFQYTSRRNESGYKLNSDEWFELNKLPMVKEKLYKAGYSEDVINSIMKCFKAARAINDDVLQYYFDYGFVDVAIYDYLQTLPEEDRNREVAKICEIVDSVI